MQHSAGQRQEQFHCMVGPPAVDCEKQGNRSSTRSSSSPTAGCSTNRPRHHQTVRAGVGIVGAVTPSAQGDLRTFYEPARRSSSPRCRNFRSSWTRSATSIAGDKFAIVIDEAHSPPGRAARPRRCTWHSVGTIGRGRRNHRRRNQPDHGIRKMLSNASYFAFTATPKNKTLEIFGDQAAGRQS